nr:sigma-70 family RNA polymerase sigma factor [Pseudonocardia nigra]
MGTDTVAAAVAGDESAFGRIVERHRNELQVHCYRMLGSFAEAEDLVQETFLRAWRRRETYAGRSTFRAWLYKIATNACLDHLERHPRQPVPRPGGLPAEVTWLQPYPDRLLDRAAPGADEPDAVVVERETIELAFLVAVQHLPPRQRAVLILRDVLGWPAAETADLLEVTVASVNSGLQRARATLREKLPPRRTEWAPAGAPSEREREVLRQFMAACERADVAALGALMREDALFTMPPEPEWIHGRDAIISSWATAMAGPDAWGDFRCVPIWTNRQPAAANYLRRRGNTQFRAVTIDVLRIEDGLVTEVVTFGSELFPAFGLPATL